jgi:hypothetical protein
MLTLFAIWMHWSPLSKFFNSMYELDKSLSIRAWFIGSLDGSFSETSNDSFSHLIAFL